MSTRRVLLSAAARDAAKFTAVVVFPTPPFWFATAITFFMGIQEPPQDVSEALFVIKKGFSITRPEEKQPLLIKFFLPPGLVTRATLVNRSLLAFLPWNADRIQDVLEDFLNRFRNRDLRPGTGMFHVKQGHWAPKCFT
jgi:hypothetical protein